MLIGDKASDQQVARAPHLACGIHALNGKAQQQLSRAAATEAFSVYAVERPDDAVPFVHGAASAYRFNPSSNCCNG